MKNLRNILTGIIFFCSGQLSAAWQATDYPLSQVSNNDYAAVWSSRYTSIRAEVSDVVVDSAGNTYATGMIDDGVNADILTTKHDANGNLLWEDRLDCPGLVSATNCYDRGVALALDDNNNLYVAGDSHNGSDNDIVVYKYDVLAMVSVGADATANDWSGSGRYAGTLVDGITATNDVLVDIAVGGSDKVYVTGTTCAICNPILKDINNNYIGSDADFVTVRFLTSGNVNWVSRYDSTVFDINGDPVGNAIDDVPVGLGIGPSGNVLVGGTSKGVTDDYVVMKYNAVNGNVDATWQGAHFYDSAANDIATSVAVDASGDVYVVGWSRKNDAGSCSDVTGDILVAKFSGLDGSLAWEPDCIDGGLGRDLPLATRLDDNDNLYIAAKTGIIPSDYFTVKLDSQGAVAWQKTYDIGEDDTPNDIAIDTAGNVFVTGGGGTILSHNLTTIRYDSAGQLTDVVSQDFGGDELAMAIGLGQDSDGDTVVNIGAVSDRVSLGQVDYLVSQYAVMQPDLIVNSVTSPALFPYDVSITVDVVVENVLDSLAGKMAVADPFSIGIYLWPSANPDPTTVDVLPAPILTYNSTGLDAGANSGQLSLPWVVSDTVPLGDYDLVAVVDDGEAVSEQGESLNILGNNILVGNLITVIDPPDLVISSVSGPTSMPAGNNIDVNYTVTNLRSTPTDVDFKLDLFLRNIGTAVDTALIVVDQADAIVPPPPDIGWINGSYSGTVTVTIPASLAPGDYYIGVSADSGEVILESNETNNTATSAANLPPSNIITVQPIPNLVVTAVDGPLGAVVDTSMDVLTTVTALSGSGDVVDDFTVAVYLSLDTNFDPLTDFLLGTPRTVTQDLVAGTLNTGTVTGLAPSTSGVYYVYADVDSGNTVLENDETDNITASALTISIGLPAGTGGKPDLLVTNVSLTAQNGLDVSITTTVDNVLPEPVPVSNPFMLGIYLSEDAAITTTDLRIGGREISGIAGNYSDQASVDITLPSETTEDVIWTNLLGVSVDPVNTLTSDIGSPTYGSGAVSAQRIAADGAVEITASEASYRMFGLSYSDSGFSTIDYAIWMWGTGAMRIYEKGVDRGFVGGGYNAGQVLRIERQGSTVRYLKEGVVIYTSTVPSSGSMLVDTAFNTFGGTIANAKITNVILAPGSYYLGAIVDDTDPSGNVSPGVNRVDEMNENNNSNLQTVSGIPETIAVSVLNVSANESGSNSGGGALGFLEALLMLSLMLLRRVFRPVLSAYHS